MRASRLSIAFALLVWASVARTQRFASAVIRPSDSRAPGASRLQVLPSGDLIGQSVPVVELIGLAYALPENPSPRLTALPEWAVRQRFDIEAKTSTSLELDRKDMQTQRRTIGLLLQKLLSDRFGLVLEVRTVVTPVYALTFSGKDEKLTQSTISPRYCILDTGPEGCHSFAIGFGHPLNANAVDMFDLAHYLENWTDLPVVDRTGANGLFAMHSQGWQPMNLPPPPPGVSGTGAEFADLSTLSAVLSGFGLQLRREEVSLPFYTVERLNQPAAR
ncbi:MAG: TIGR03435 family protein [Terracidiphilus sp.]